MHRWHLQLQLGYVRVKVVKLTTGKLNRKSGGKNLEGMEWFGGKQTAINGIVVLISVSK